MTRLVRIHQSPKQSLQELPTLWVPNSMPTPGQLPEPGARRGRSGALSETPQDPAFCQRAAVHHGVARPWAEMPRSEASLGARARGAAPSPGPRYSLRSARIPLHQERPRSTADTTPGSFLGDRQNRGSVRSVPSLSASFQGHPDPGGLCFLCTQRWRVRWVGVWDAAGHSCVAPVRGSPFLFRDQVCSPNSVRTLTPSQLRAQLRAVPERACA